MILFKKVEDWDKDTEPDPTLLVPNAGKKTTEEPDGLSEEDANKFKQTVKHIVTHGVGAIQLIHNDGRGAGFGAFATDLMLTERGLADSSDEAYRQLGVGYDSRDYDASIVLLKHHLSGDQIQMIMNSPSSLVRKPEYAQALKKHRLNVDHWIFLGTDGTGD
jgi:3,4-dihydroxy 2-butanone 4-phosphate synthase/GTP cyclohydrolase II